MVAVPLEHGAGLLDEGAHLVFADMEEVGEKRGGQAALVQNGGPDDVLDSQFPVPGPLGRRHRVDHVAELGDEAVQRLAGDAGEGGVGGQGRVEGVGRAGVSAAVSWSVPTTTKPALRPTS
ncbi:hypothetical protein [Streptomyces sp. SD31]|uniref:hypothetical protein n=1 Tax=Streptomyces sp. SD31 TaxID=3452208 RepID=UPI003F894146